MKVKQESEKVGLKLNIQKTKIMAFGSITSGQIDGETMEIVADFIFLGSKITVYGACSHEIKVETLICQQFPSSQDYGFSSGHVWMWEVDYEENWVLKNWCFWTVVLEKTLDSPLDYKEIQSVHSKGDQSWVFIGRSGVEAETPILWWPDAKSWLIWKDPDAGKDRGQE